MWSFFSRDPTKDFAYEIGEKINALDNKSLWSLHDGKKKANGDPVSIFVYENKLGNEPQMAFVKATFKRMKTLRHPNFLIYLDGLETEKSCYVVTEPVSPLSAYLENELDKESHEVRELAISWGLHQVAKAISFLTNDLNTIHNNVCTSSIFVDRAGEWKLGGLDYAYPCTGPESFPTIKGFPDLERYEPPERTGKKAGEKWSTDMWGLGCLIWEVFNGSFVKSTSLKNLGQIPKSLVSNYCELVSANPRSRPNPSKFIEACRSKGGFMDNKFVSAMLFIEEIQIQDSESKQSFFNSLAQSVDSFPTSFCKQKILPQLLHAFEFGSTGSAILAPLFKLGKLLTAEEYQKKMMPCIVKLFSSTDRATRVKLLQQMEMFAEHLSPSVVNEQIFPSIASGFLDTNPVVREQTIKSMLHLAPKLNYKNLNEELLKHFARLQSKDEQGGIRTNTTVCLGKIACYLYPQIRQKVLISAYFRALKDPFPPARQAGVLAIAATQNFFTLEDSAMKLLPALCQLTRDPEKSVRDQVFRTVKSFLGRLEKVSEDPECQMELEKDVNAAGIGAASATGWAGWAVSGMTSLTSKIYPGKKTAQQTSSTSVTKTGSNEKDKQEIPKTEPTKNPTPSSQSLPAKTRKLSVPLSDKATDDDDDIVGGGDDDDVPQSKHNDGWGDQDWGDIEDSISNKTVIVDSKSKEGSGWDDEDDADWGSLDEMGGANNEASQSQGGHKFVVTPDHVPASSYNWDQNKTLMKKDDDEFFNSLITKKDTKSSAALNLKTKPAPSSSLQPSIKSTTSSKTSSLAGSRPSSSQKSKTADQWENSDWNDLDDWTNNSWSDKTNKSKR